MNVALRRQQDQERARMRALDIELERRGEKPYFLYNWTIKTYPIEENEMARPRGAKNKPKASTEAEAFAEAIAFVSVAATKDQEFYQEHVRLAGQMIVAFDGQIAAGHPIAEELSFCPHLGKLKTAINKAGSTLAIAELPTGRLSIKGDKLRAMVPCLPAGDMPSAIPDAPCAAIDDRIKQAFAVCNAMASEASDRVVCASLLLEANQCTGTNGAAMVQYWHGIDLPPGMVIPKIFAAAVVKSSKPLTGFGFSWRDMGNNNWIVGSVTFWFDGGAWIKTQCYNDRWPDIAGIIDVPFSVAPVPDSLFEAIEIVSEFNEYECVRFGQDMVCSHLSPEVGAQYEVKGLPGGKQFAGKLVKQVKPFVTGIDLTTYPDRAFFVGENLRGVLTCIKEGSEPETIEPPKQLSGWGSGPQYQQQAQEPSATIGNTEIVGDDDVEEDEDEGDVDNNVPIPWG